MKYELRLNGDSLGIFDQEPQDIVFSNTNNGLTFLCFNSDEWELLKKKLGVSCDDNDKKYKTYSEIMNSNFCKKHNIMRADDLAEALGFGKLEYFGRDRVEYRADMIKRYAYVIDFYSATAGVCDFSFCTDFKGIHQVLNYADRWIICDTYHKLEISSLSDEELAKFDLNEINNDLNRYDYYNVEVEKYELVSVKHQNFDKPSEMILIWTYDDSKKDFMDCYLKNISKKWVKL